MKIVVGLPPVYGRIVEVLGTPPPTVIFTWADTIYAPSGDATVTPDLEAHELVHQRQQEAVGGPEVWWDRYLAEPAWRAQQELEAYRIHYAFMRQRIRDRNALARFRASIAGSLAGPIYGRVMDFQTAYREIGR